jgi:hypothetical protein
MTISENFRKKGMKFKKVSKHQHIRGGLGDTYILSREISGLHRGMFELMTASRKLGDHRRAVAQSYMATSLHAIYNQKKKNMTKDIQPLLAQVGARNSLSVPMCGPL